MDIVLWRVTRLAECAPLLLQLVAALLVLLFGGFLTIASRSQTIEMVEGKGVNIKTVNGAGVTMAVSVERLVKESVPATGTP